MAQDNNSAPMDQVLRRLKVFNDKLQRQSNWRNQPNHPELPTIIDQYVKRDFWKLQEALNILRGYHPDRAGWGNRRDSELARSSVGPGGSLKVINPQEAVRHWKVKPKDFIKWAIEKGLQIDPAMKHSVNGPAKKHIPTTPVKTVQANQSRKSEKKARLDALEWMREEIDRRAQNRSWDSRNIPATKKDFLDIFFTINPDLKKVEVDTLAGDLPDIGIKFQSGQKARKDNVLAGLFKDLI
ncbi:MAG: hypothetical protein ABW170_03730 [Candidatus Thiodiazotropha sp. L084R]